MTLNKFTGLTARQKLEKEQLLKMKNIEMQKWVRGNSGFEKKVNQEMPSYLQNYFTKKEFTKAIKDSFKPLNVIQNQTVKKTCEINESDSEPSCDNYDLKDLVDQY